MRRVRMSVAGSEDRVATRARSDPGSGGEPRKDRAKRRQFSAVARLRSWPVMPFTCMGLAVGGAAIAASWSP
ncbi:MAG: hypothetical protein ACYCS7_06210 [Acidimicrobiales bacterium]